MDAEKMLIDEQLPVYDVVIAEHLVVDADPDATLQAAWDLDFLTVRTPLIDAAMAVRGLPDRLRHREQPPVTRLELARGIGLTGWLALGERKGEEVVFGAVGKFWQPSIEWRDVPPSDFATFDEPGWGKIACNFSVRPYGAGKTLLTYECRTATTDQTARRKFLRYWWLIRPFAAYMMRAALNAIAADAARSHDDQPVDG